MYSAGVVNGCGGPWQSHGEAEKGISARGGGPVGGEGGGCERGEGGLQLRGTVWGAIRGMEDNGGENGEEVCGAGSEGILCYCEGGVLALVDDVECASYLWAEGALETPVH